MFLSCSLACRVKGLSEEDLYDLGLSFIRPRLANVKGASIPLPYGGKVRQVQVDADPNQMYAHHLSATDISTAFNQQNLILPAGVARMGDREFIVKLNSSPPEVSALNDLPIRASNGAVVLVKDVAQVRLGYAPQVNIVRQDGQRAALLTVLKNGETSTLDIVKGVKQLLPQVKAGLPAIAADHSAVRSIHLCERVHQRGGSRGRHRSRSHGIDDPAVSRIMALDADCLHVHPVVYRDLAGHPVRLRSDHQRDDTRRSRACRRHPGGRRNRRDREHAPQHERAEAAGAGHPRQCAAGGGARLRLDAFHLPGFHARAAAQRTRRSTCSRPLAWPSCSP